jgi:hypothetical protein
VPFIFDCPLLPFWQQMYVQWPSSLYKLGSNCLLLWSKVFNIQKYLLVRIHIQFVAVWTK